MFKKTFNNYFINYRQIFKVKKIRALKVDVINKAIYQVEVEDHLEFLQNKFGFFEYERIAIKDQQECLIIGSDKDLEGENYFLVKGIQKRYYGNAVLVKLPKNLVMDRFQNTKITIEFLRNLITFY